MQTQYNAWPDGCPTKGTGRRYIVFIVLAAGVMLSCKHAAQGLMHTTAHLLTRGKT